MLFPQPGNLLPTLGLAGSYRSFQISAQKCMPFSKAFPSPPVYPKSPVTLPHVDRRTSLLHYNPSPELHLRLHLKKVSECFSLKFEIQWPTYLLTNKHSGGKNMQINANGEPTIKSWTGVPFCDRFGEICSEHSLPERLLSSSLLSILDL